ncbi:MAG TPA: Trp biosynthesis-associated membrane protein [Actinomycetes bacterium]
MTVRREVTGVLALAVTGGALLLVAEPVLGLVVLAGAGAAALLRPRARAAVAAVVLLVGLAVLAVAWDRGSAVLAVGGVLVVTAAAAATVRSGRWPPPRRRPEPSGGEPSARDTWDALDRGEDPTA